MLPLRLLCVLGLVCSPLAVLVTSLEHQWVSHDGISDSVEEVPVLHTAFVQTGEELHYFSESSRYDAEKFVGHRVHQDQTAKTSCKERKYHVKRETTEDSSLPIEFDPPSLDFGSSFVAVPVQKRVVVRSRLNKVVVLDSIIGSSVAFHASFFDSQQVEALGSTSFDVAFLPREEGEVAATLSIHTSAGIFIYNLSGRSQSNPYRISPFVGHRLSFNATVSRPIHIHNPHPQMMRIKSIYSSGGNAHVELPFDIDPSLAGETPQYWNIRPYQSQTVGRLLMIGHSLENSTSFVSVNGVLLDSQGREGQLVELMLTVPFEVSKTRGVYSTSDLLDFGLLRQGERSQHLTFSVYQYGIEGKLHFETLYVEKGDATGIYMEFASNPPIAVHAGKERWHPGRPSDLVKVFFDASRIHFDDKKAAVKHFAGRIIAVSRGGRYNITIPFRASVYQGDILPMRNDLAIQEDLRPPHRRSVRLRNQLSFPVAVYNISVSPDASQFFTVRLFEKSTVLPVGEDRPVFLLKYNKKVPDLFGSAEFYVHTNVSTFRLQLWKFSGKVKMELLSVDKDQFNFGLIERNDTRTIRFLVHNPNRASMSLRPVRLPEPAVFRLYSVDAGKNGGSYRELHQGAELDVSPNTTKTFDLELRVPMDGSQLDSSLVMETDYESRAFDVTYQVAVGGLASIPETMSFGQTFPGKVVYRNLQIFNSFTEDMTVTKMSVLNKDRRFYFENFDAANPPVLRSGRLTNLGRVMFMPDAPCSQEDCYLGMPLDGNDGQWFVHGLTLPANLAEVDSYLYKRQRARFDNLVAAGKNIVNETIVLDTDKAKNIRIPTSAELVWPRLLTRNSIHFPLTALGNFTIVNLTLANPTAMPVVVQVIPLVIYPDAEAVVEFFRDHLLTPLTSQVEMNETLMFSLRDTELFTLKPESPVPQLREELEGAIKQSVPKFTLSLLLKPHMKVRLRLGFLPSDYTLRSSLLLIRNNLTVMEPVVVYGRGARIGMKVEGVEARSKKPLLFEIKHDHLADCNNPKRLMHKLHSTLTVRRPFTVSNTGEVPFTVVNMSINGFPCENRGFRILNCYPFRLGPNETYSLDIAYTPDFLTTTNEADLQLYMHMNGTSWLFPLAATVPPDMMARCHRALPRPPFENLMYYSCVTALVFCLVCVLACAYLEGDRAIACAIREQYTATRTIFDLNHPEPLRRTTPPEEPAPRQPAGLHAAADASAISRIFYRAANQAIKAVHAVWRLTLLIRRREETPRAPTTKKKKKTKVSVVGSKPKDKDAPKEEEKQPQETAPVKEKPKEAAKPVHKHLQQKKSTAAGANNNNNKLTAKASVSPKAPTHSRATEAKEQQRKKSTQETERRLAKTQKLMDDFDAERERSSRNTGPAQKTSAAIDIRRAAAPPPQPPVARPTTPIQLPSMPPRSPSPSVHNLLSTPVTIGHSIPHFDEDDSFSIRPPTPTPSLASSYSFDDRVLDFKFPAHEDSSATSREPSPSQLGVPLRIRNASEGEMSVASDHSAPPDWMDEAVINGNVEADFSALVKASEFMGSGSEWGGESVVSSVGEEDKKLRKRRRGRGGKKRQEERKEEQKLLTETSNGVAEGGRPRTNTFGNWPMPDLPLGPLYGIDNQQNAAAMWPQQLPSLAPGQLTSLTPGQLPPLIPGQLPSLAPGTQWMTQDQSGTATAALQQWQEENSSLWANPLDTNLLGLNLGPTFGSIFPGSDFNLWSQESASSDPSASWTNLMNNLSAEKKEEGESKKNT